MVTFQIQDFQVLSLCSNKQTNTFPMTHFMVNCKKIHYHFFFAMKVNEQSNMYQGLFTSADVGYIYITRFNSFFFRPKLSGMMVNSYVCKRQESSSGAVHAHIEPKWEPHVHNNNNNVISVTVK